MNNQLKRVLNIARKTGDKIIVFDSSKPNDAYVLLPLDDYENDLMLNNCCDDECDDECCCENEDNSREEYFGETESEFDNFNQESEEDVDEINRRIAFLKNDEEINEQQYNDFENQRPENRKGWVIPESRKEGAEEVIEEDRQYLEEIKF